ncbi:MAG: heme o synthase [Methylacidiphilales bacterium]|nr:heme o synthase [Candidatus Methylacidiphilales bacterium]
MNETAVELRAAAPLRTFISDLSELTKSRLSLLVLFTTLTGFYLGSFSGINPWLLIHTLAATASLAAGAAVLNQVLETQADALMLRTRNRPLPSSRMREQDALCLGIYLSGGGLAYLLLATNLLAFSIAALTLFSYLFIYTPLKRVTPLNTLIGAVPGALPPLIGWTAAGNPLNDGALALFLILFFWQMPHFLAIAWLYREDYSKAGFRMLTLNDASGQSTAWKSLLHTLLLLPCGLAPYFLGMTGWIYLSGATFCGALYLAASLFFVRNPGHVSARRLFLASIFYLPVILLLLAIDKV